MEQDPWRSEGSAEEVGESPLTGEIIDAGSRGEIPERNVAYPFRDQEGIGGWIFGPRSFGGGRVQVYGCSPGCIIFSCIVSVVLSILLTLLLNWIF